MKYLQSYKEEDLIFEQPQLIAAGSVVLKAPSNSSASEIALSAHPLQLVCCTSTHESPKEKGGTLTAPES